MRRPPFSTRKIVEQCFPDVLVAGSTLPRGVAEFVSLGARGPVIVYNRKLPTPDQRFSIAHGLGHVVFDLADLGAPFRPLKKEGRARDKREARAEAFAAELLVPLESLGAYVEDADRSPSPSARQAHLDLVDELASEFQVAQAVIRGRIRDLAKHRKAAQRK